MIDFAYKSLLNLGFSQLKKNLTQKYFFFTNFSLTLPDTLKATDIKWLSVWCRTFQVNSEGFLMGSAALTQETNKLVKVGNFYRRENPRINSEVFIKDEKTLIIKGFPTATLPHVFFVAGPSFAPLPSVGSISRFFWSNGYDNRLLPKELGDNSTLR